MKYMNKHTIKWEHKVNREPKGKGKLGNIFANDLELNEESQEQDELMLIISQDPKCGLPEVRKLYAGASLTFISKWPL